MTLPTSRDITLAPSSQFPSALGNRLQDCVIGNKKPTMYRAVSMQPIQNIGAVWTANLTAGFFTSTGSAVNTLQFQLPFEVGDRITGLVANAFGNGVTDVNYAVLAFAEATMVGAILLNDTDSNRAAAWGLYNNPGGFTPRVMALGDYLTCQIDPNAAGYKLGPLFVAYDRL